MSWWDTGHHDDVVGDRPVEIMGKTITELADAILRCERRKLTLMEVLAGVADAIRQEPKEFILARDIPIIRVNHPAPGVRPGAGPADRADGPREGAENPELRQTLRRAFISISGAYAEEQGRKPRLSELMACLTTVLETRAELFQSDADPLSPEEVCLEEVCLEEVCLEEEGLEGPQPAVGQPPSAPASED